MKNQNKLVKIAVSAALGAAMLAPTAWGLGLGKIESKTQLNQPLSARINLLSSKDFLEEDLSARIASYEAYGKFGVSREPIHGQFKFEVKEADDGSKYILVTSTQGIKEPYLNFLVELKWPQGRLLREYTLLLDPPALSSNKQQVVAVEKPRSTTRPAPVRTTRRVSENQSSFNSEPEVSSSEAEPAPEPESTNKTKVQFTGDSWRVGRGETLWRIATKVRPNGASINQTLAALYRNNPDAFINNDIDRLKAGATLRVPPTSQIDTAANNVTYRDLKTEQGGSSEAPLDVRKTVAETASSSENETSGRLTISSVTESDLTDTSGANVEEGADGDVSQGSQDDSLDTVDPLAVAGEQLKTELESVINEDESNGVALEDETLSVISGSAEAKDDQDDALQALATEAQDALDNTDSAMQDLNVQEPVKAEPTVETNKPVTQPKPKTVAEKAFWQKFSFWKWPLMIIGGLLALFGVGTFLKKRREALDEEIFTPSTENTEAFEKQQPSFAKETMVAPEVDTNPLDEADILIARGKLDDVEKLLLDALDKDPENFQARVKLMEVYSSSDDQESLMQQFDLLGDSFDHDSELGLKVAGLMTLQPEVPVVEEAEIQIDESSYVSEEQVFGEDVPEKEIDLSNEVDQMFDGKETTSSSVDNVIDFSSSENAQGNSDDESSEEVLSEDEAHTKIELAKAYISMGDEESAVEILKEVEKEASSELRQVASELLADL